MTNPITSPTGMHQIDSVIKRLRALTQVNVQQGWRCCNQDLAIAVATQPQAWATWSAAELNPKDYIVWSAGQQVMWLGQQLIVPQDLQSFPLAGFALRIALTWWAQSAQIFVNGQLVQEGDLFDSSARVLLSAAVVPGETFAVALRLVSPSHDIGALMRSRSVYEAIEDIDPGFVADELAVLQKYLAAFEPTQLDALAEAIAQIDWQRVSQAEDFRRSLATLRQNLQPLVKARQRKIQLLGHAHLDLAWLWTLDETWAVAERTFESVLKLQHEFPELTFCHSTPALYAWIEQHRPDLFTIIQQQIATGRWEVVGGMWVEPELNLINGESIVRQVLYAQRYAQEKFGELTRVAWVPDSFGFCWQLPQILKQGGLEYFVTQKLHWNDTTQFPYGAFWWQSPDGSQIFSLMSPPNTTGVMDTNPLTMATYAVDWEIQTHRKAVFWLPGVGDHGGGPTRDMLQVAERWQQSSFFPRLEFTTAHAYLQALRGDGEVGRWGEGLLVHSLNFPVWDDELYLEFHRGCYTTHADQKRWNRRCEDLLYQAELFASLATITTGYRYPKLELEAAWKKVLFNQFHDILPGTSIQDVFVEANQAWQNVEQVGLEIVAASLNAIASQIALPPPPQPEAQPILVFNSLNWQRSEIVAIALPAASEATWAIYDSEQKLSSQLSDTSTLIFLAKDVPSVGYRVFWLCQEPRAGGKRVEARDNVGDSFISSQALEAFVLENECLRVVVDPNTGDLQGIFDKVHQREVLSGAGNQLQAFQDQGQYWDAWNIDPNYAQHPLPPAQLQSIRWLERGIVRSRLAVVRQLGQSQFYQEYVLETESPILKIVTTVDWQERHVLVKAAFPLNVEADYATYEIACGAIERPTRPQTAAEQAKWEVPALRWADLSEDDYGVSLLNDCKYGYDAQPSRLRLTLLRGSNWPDPEADQGIHHFTYALYPHSKSWQSAGTVQRAYELNLPLQVLHHFSGGTLSKTSLSPTGQLLNLQAENLILIAFKQAEDHPNQWVLRCYECHGKAAELILKSDLDLAIAHPVNLLEIPEQPVAQYPLQIQPWKIASFTVFSNQ